MLGINLSVFTGAGNGSSVGGNNMGLYIAASDAPAEVRANAWKVCDGTNDEATIQSGIDYLLGNGAALGGIVALSPGHFYISNPILMKGGIALWGEGMKATILQLANSAQCDMVQFHTPYTFKGTATGGSTTTLLDSSLNMVVNANIGKTLRVTSGGGAGLRGVCTANSVSGFTVTAWTTPIVGAETAPVSGCLYTVGETTDLFQSYRGFTTVGNYLNNVPVTGSMTTPNRDGFTDSAKTWTVNQFAYRLSVEVTADSVSGNSVGQVRLIKSNTIDTVVLDSDWQILPSSSATYKIAGHGLAFYGEGSFDVDTTDIWTSYHAGHGVYTEQTWGWTGKFISEYNSGDGMRVELNPAQRAALSPSEGPKLNSCKFVRNAGSGFRNGVYVYGCQCANVEAAGGDAGTAGFFLRGGKEHVLNGCKVTSHGNQTSTATADRRGVIVGNAAALHSTIGVSINGCIFRSTASGMMPYAIDLVSATSCCTVGNVFDLTSADRPYYDRDGRNTIGDNAYPGNPTIFKSSGTVTKQSIDTSTITFNPGLGTPVPASDVVVVTAIPANDAALAAGPWSVVSSAYNAVVLKATGTLGASTDFVFHVTCAFNDRGKVPS